MLYRKLIRSRFAGSPFAVLVTALLLTGISTSFVYQTEMYKDRERLQAATEDASDDIRNRMSAYITILSGASGLSYASPAMNRAMFQDYVAHLDLERKFPGIRGIGYSVKVEPGEESRLVRRMREEGVPDFHLWPERKGLEKHAILYLQPLDRRNRAAIGYNMFSESVRRAAMSEARDTGQPILSGKVRLVQEIYGTVQPGFLVYYPLYRKGALADTPERRRRALVGFVYGAFRSNDLFNGIFGSRYRHPIRLEVYDGRSLMPSRLLNRSDQGIESVAMRLRFQKIVELPVAGRIWTLRITAGSRISDGSPYALPLAVSLSGALASALLFALTLSEARARAAGDRITAELRISEGRLRFLAEASSLLSSSLDAETILKELAASVIPYLADWCLADLLETDGTLRRLAAEHPDPEKKALAWEISRRHPPSVEEEGVVSSVVRTGEALFFPIVAEDDWNYFERKEIRLDISKSLGLVSMIAVPILARDRILGVLTLAMGESGRRYQPEDLTLAKDLGRRTGIAIDNALLFREIQETDRRKDEFLATLSHELRNPLAPLTNALSLMKLRLPDDPQLHRAREIMEGQVRYMTRLIEDLLDVSRITRGVISLKREIVALEAIVDQAIQTSRPLMEERRHRLSVRLPEDPVFLDADPARIVQVVANLLNNAAKYTAPGGEIALTGERENGFVALSVKDDGIGIRSDMLPRIFDLFAQADPKMDRSQGGLGLGLTLSRRLTEMHGGTLSASSPGIGMGSEFVLRLPVTTFFRRLEEPDREAAIVKPSPSRRILVADDNRDSADLLRETMELWGHQARVAYDGLTALAEAEAFLPEAIFLDIGLPQADGFEVARRLRENPAFQNALIVAISGFGQAGDRRKTKDAGFDYHFTKPADLDALKNLIDAMETS